MQKINITKQVDLSKFNYVNSIIKDIKHKTGDRYLKLYHPNKYISSEDCVKDIENMTETIDGITYKGRPATIEELAMYEGDENCIIALGEKIRDDSREFVAYRGIFDSERKLYLGSWSGDWFANFRFLVAFDISDTKGLSPSPLTLGHFDSTIENDAIKLLKSLGYKITKEY